MHGNDLLQLLKVLRLLEAGYENVIAGRASYSDPVATVRRAEELGYRVVNFLAMGLDFGPYSSEPKVAGTSAAVRRGPRLGRRATATWSPWRCSPGTPRPRRPRRPSSSAALQLPVRQWSGSAQRRLA